MVGLATDIGNVRDCNEDYLDVYLDIHKKLLVVADGMGGHQAGEIASKLAVDTLMQQIKTSGLIEEPESFLTGAIKKSNEEIFMLAQQNSNMSGMGTTLTAALIIDDIAYIANVGDSGCFLYRDNKISKITKDHSLVQQLIDNGTITENEALRHPKKNIITRALGTYENVEVDIFKIILKPMDRLILYTDGLTNELSLQDFYEVINEKSNQKVCDLLIEKSKASGGADNISIIVAGGENEW